MKPGWRPLYPDGVYNCGRCEKCLRTMINLLIAGGLDRCTTFPHPLDPGSVRDMVISKESTRVFIRENLKALETRQIHPALAEALRFVLDKPTV